MDDVLQTNAPWREVLPVLSHALTALTTIPMFPVQPEESLDLRLRHAESMVNTVHLPLLVLDATWHVRLANRSFYELFQTTPQETLAHSLYDISHGAWNLPVLRDLLEQSVSQQTPVDAFEVTPTFPHRGLTTLRLNARPMLHPHGASLVLLAIEDLTARRRNEMARQQEHEVLALTLGSIGDAVLATDTEGRITFLNPVAEALTGWPLADALGQPCEEVFRLIHAQTRQPLESPVARVLRSGLVLDLAPQTSLLTRDGREIPIADLSAPIRRGDGPVHGVVVVFRDGADLRALEEQLRQAQKMEALGTLAGGIAHDFNNILVSILGYAELIQDDMPSAHPSRTWIGHVITASLRAKALVQQILTFSRQGVPDQTAVSLAAVLRETLPFLQAVLPTSIRLEAHLPPEESLVRADVTQLHQVLMNLGANAVYALRDTGGLLEVSLEAIDVDAAGTTRHPDLRPGPYMRLTVRDTGPGIPPEVLARMYEPFFTTKGVGEGTGLGLSVVHGIVEAHRGVILVESPPGQGTTFTIYLPRLVERLAGAPQLVGEHRPRPTA